MKWKYQRRHFFEATRQSPAPVEGDCFEWDYSRYARALGMTSQPSLNDQPFACFGIVGGEPELWREMRAEYGRWARASGWTFLPIHARPTVVVPDPVVRALGVEAAGDEDLVLLRSGQAGTPALGPRLRAPGCSIPVASGERWLMAADRIRRRARAEIARRGLVLFIEEAELLTASALNVLRYLGNAHRAWQARMLSRDARLYVVLATQRGHEMSLRRALERVGVTGEVPVARRRLPAEEQEEQRALERLLAREGAGGAQAPAEVLSNGGVRIASGRRMSARDRQRTLTATLGVEEEHLLAGIRAAPYAPAESDVLEIFGASSRPRIEGLVERGFLVRRVEAGTPCLMVHCEIAGELPECPVRVLNALIDSYRARLRRRRGHHHAAPALALLYLRTGRPHQAIASLGRIVPGYTATVPLALADELAEYLTTTRIEQRASHHAVQFAMRAQLHDYVNARIQSDLIQQRTIRTPRDFARLMHHILGTGKTHLRRSVPRHFWAALSSTGFSEDSFEHLSIACDLFCRGKLMSVQDSRNRAAVLLGCAVPPDVQNCKASDSKVWLSAMETLFRIWCATLMRSHPEIDSEAIPNCSRWEDTPVAPATRSATVPAVVVGSLHYWKRQVRQHRCEQQVESVYSSACRYSAASGHPLDTRVLRSAQLAALIRRGLRLLLAGIADEQLLVIDAKANEATLRFAATTISLLAGSVRGVHALLGPRFMADTPFPGNRITASASERLAGMFMGSGEVAQAIAWQRLAKQRAPGSSAMLCRSLLLEWSVAWWTLDPDIAARVRDSLRSDLNQCPGHVSRYWGCLLVATHCLDGGDFRNAAKHFSAAADALDSHDSGHGVFTEAVRVARTKARTAVALGEAHMQWKECAPDEAEGLRALIARLRSINAEVMYDPASAECQFGAIAREVLLAIEHAVLPAAEASDRAIIQVGCWLWEAQRMGLGVSGQQVLEGIAGIAPKFTLRLRNALESFVGVGPSATKSSQVWSGWLSIVAGIAGKNFDSGALWVSLSTILGARPQPAPNLRRATCSVARELDRQWDWDGATFRLLLASRSVGPSDAGEALRTCRAYAAVPDMLGSVHVQEVSLVGLGAFGTEDSQGELGICHGPSLRPDRVDTETLRVPAPRGRRRPRRKRTIEHLFLGVSEASEVIRRHIAAASACAHPVLVIGETGVGKEVVARAVHWSSRNRTRRFVVADCACTVDSLLYSMLFGHEKGAFTGAVARSDGVLASVDGGTLFLDEVSSMSPAMQGALLRVLECKEYRPLGSTRVQIADFRLVSAAFPTVQNAVNRGAFREDLFYRISAFKIEIPPLRERVEDIEFLASHFADLAGKSLTQGARKVLCREQWKGNVRQLQNAVKVAAVLAVGRLIDVAVLRDALGATAVASVSSPPDTASLPELAWRRFRVELASGDRFTRTAFAGALSLAGRTAQRYLSYLVRQGILVRSGKGRATVYWEPQ